MLSSNALFFSIADLATNPLHHLLLGELTNAPFRFRWDRLFKNIVPARLLIENPDKRSFTKHGTQHSFYLTEWGLRVYSVEELCYDPSVHSFIAR